MTQSLQEIVEVTRQRVACPENCLSFGHSGCAGGALHEHASHGSGSNEICTLGPLQRRALRQQGLPGWRPSPARAAHACRLSAAPALRPFCHPPATHPEVLIRSACGCGVISQVPGHLRECSLQQTASLAPPNRVVRDCKGQGRAGQCHDEGNTHHAHIQLAVIILEVWAPHV